MTAHLAQSSLSVTPCHISIANSLDRVVEAIPFDEAVEYVKTHDESATIALGGDQGDSPLWP